MSTSRSASPRPRGTARPPRERRRSSEPDPSTSYFDDDSVIRRVMRERAVALSGSRALLMQAAHPLAVAGLLAHSDALEDPYVRLARTAKIMNLITFGARPEANPA